MRGRWGEARRIPILLFTVPAPEAPMRPPYAALECLPRAPEGYLFMK